MRWIWERGSRGTVEVEQQGTHMEANISKLSGETQAWKGQ
jgi:hypothetical protein